MTENVIDSFVGEYYFLSNFYPCSIEHDGLQYPSSEHAYQAAKSPSKDKRKECLNMTPGQCKKWGRSIGIRYDWDDIKIYVMEQILVTKFSDKILNNLLLETYPKELIEGNTWGDTFWGMCNGKGKNNLGKLLIKIRNGYIIDQLF